MVRAPGKTINSRVVRGEGAGGETTRATDGPSGPWYGDP